LSRFRQPDEGNRRTRNGAQDLIEFSGTVRLVPNAMLRVKFESDRQAPAHTASKVRKNRVRVLAGDRIYVEVTPYDLSKGRLTFGFK
jgi:translation initiation factor IF-1